MLRLSGFNQVIEAELEVTGARMLAPDDVREPAIRIRRAEAEATGTQAGAVYAVEGEDLVFSAPGIARYRCRPGEIEISPRPGAAAGELGALLIATALPAVLWMQGRVVLHASAVRLPGMGLALAIAGASGSGKSTIAAELVAGGAKLVADDSLGLDIGPGGVCGSGLPGGIHIAVEGEEGRTFRPVAEPDMLTDAPLGAIFVLAEAGGEWSIERLGPVAALEQVLRHRHRHAVPAMLGRRAQVLRDCASAVRTVPVFAWRRPRNRPELHPEELSALANHMRSGASGNG